MYYTGYFLGLDIRPMQMRHPLAQHYFNILNHTFKINESTNYTLIQYSTHWRSLLIRVGEQKAPW